jgi:parvulin-like peptidyl-prolyl isomerase
VLLPGGPVIPAKIAEYAGATIRDTALAMAQGQTVGPVSVGDRLVFIHLIERAETPPPPLAAVHDVVAEEWQKRESEQAFADYVDGLRRRARISYATDVPAAGQH